jgi:hypothetical protein
MAICGCGLPACCCQPAVAGRIIYADLWGELSTHLAPQALFTQSSPVHDVTGTSFPLSKHTGGGDTAPAFSGWCDYLQLTWDVGLPPSPVEFSSHRCFYKLSHSWLLGAPALSGQAWLVYLWFQAGLPSPSSVLRALHPLCYVSLLFLLLITQFLFFSLGGGWSLQGAMLIWPRVVCGSTVCCLAHLVVRIFPSHFGTGNWQPGDTSAFSIQCQVEMLCATGCVEGSKFCLFSVALPARCL